MVFCFLWLFLFFFFFSSRRRHTRWNCDWSSDVCSSDLSPRPGATGTASDLLDELLPVAKPSEVEVHHEAAVLEVDDPARLLELAADTALRPFLLCRLADREIGRASCRERVESGGGAGA